MEEFFKNLHKWKGSTFGNMTQTNKKAEDLNNHRRETRNNIMYQKRRIDANISDICTPDPKHVFNKKPSDQSTQKRLQMLAEFKQKKEKLKQQKKLEEKPLFKVCHVPVHIGLPDLENVNKEIKGVPIRKPSFAPTGHKFSAPSNIKPLDFKVNYNQVREKLDTKDRKAVPKYKEMKAAITSKTRILKDTNRQIGPPVTKNNYSSSRNRQTPVAMNSRKNYTPSVTNNRRGETPLASNSRRAQTPSAANNHRVNTVVPKKILKEKSQTKSPIKTLQKSSSVKSATPAKASANKNKSTRNSPINKIKKTPTSKATSSNASKNSPKKRPKLQAQKRVEIIDLTDSFQMESVKSNDTYPSEHNLNETFEIANESSPNNSESNNSNFKDAVVYLEKSDLSQKSISKQNKVVSETPSKNKMSVKQTPKKTPRKTLHKDNAKSQTPKKTPMNKNSQASSDTPNSVKQPSATKKAKIDDKILAQAVVNIETHVQEQKVNNKTPLKTPRRSRRTVHKKANDVVQNIVDNSAELKENCEVKKPKRGRPKTKPTISPEDSSNSSSSEAQANESCSPDYPIEDNVESDTPTSLTTPYKTPEDTRATSPAYISPFVTISRGKDSARKEYKSRSSHGGSLPQESDIQRATPTNTSPRAGAAYFTKILNDEIARITKMCDSWEKYKEENNPCESACDMINTAIGQSTLLLTKKFKQFRSFIDQCESEDQERRVTCTDLHGFWEVIYMQVKDLDKRFSYLETLRSNNWEEIMDNANKKPVAKKRGRPPKKKAAATSTLREAILAARKKKMENQQLTVPEATTEAVTFDGGFFVVRSPKDENALPVRNTPRRSARKSLLTTVLTQEAQRRSSTKSPGLTMLKAAHTSKLTEGITPGKSILKTEHNRSTVKLNKSVLFNDEVQVEGDDEYAEHENNQNTVNLIEFSPVVMLSKPTSRRTRLSRNKLF